MALIQLHFDSRFLCGDTQICCVLPDSSEGYPEHRSAYRTVWLLHGGKGDCTDWVRKTSLERYASAYGFAVVLPSAYNTMYMDWLTYAGGYRFHTFLMEELMPLLTHWLPISPAREDNFLAGLGGGGVAAFKYAMISSGRFAAAAALSTSPRDYDRLFADGLENHPKFVRAAKNQGSLEAFLSSQDNIRTRLQEGGGGLFLPMLAITGSEDHEIQQFRDFMAFSQPLGLPITYRILPGYCHDWTFWDVAIQEALAFFAGEASTRKGR